MDVFECAAYATVIQVAIWLLLVVIKTLKPDQANGVGGQKETRASV